LKQSGLWKTPSWKASALPSSIMWEDSNFNG
jgi:hypothetical protein